MQVTIRDSGDLAALSRTLRRAADGKQLRRELTKGMREELRPVLGQVRSAYQLAPSTRGIKTAERAGLGGLRELLAKAARIEIRTSGRQAGVRIRVDGRKMPAGLKGLPRAWEGRKRWRHPVYGNRNVWVSQPARPVFDQTVAPYEARVRRRVIEICNRVLQRAQRGQAG